MALAFAPKSTPKTSKPVATSIKDIKVSRVVLSLRPVMWSLHGSAGNFSVGRSSDTLS